MILEKWKTTNRGVIPKTEFPRLLKEAIDNIGLISKENSIAGFKAYGIVPLNPYKVLQKIARNIPSNHNANDDSTWT